MSPCLYNSEIFKLAKYLAISRIRHHNFTAKHQIKKAFRNVRALTSRSQIKPFNDRESRFETPYWPEKIRTAPLPAFQEFKFPLALTARESISKLICQRSLFSQGD